MLPVSLCLHQDKTCRLERVTGSQVRLMIAQVSSCSTTALLVHADPSATACSAVSADSIMLWSTVLSNEILQKVLAFAGSARSHATSRADWLGHLGPAHPHLQCP